MSKCGGDFALTIRITFDLDIARFIGISSVMIRPLSRGWGQAIASFVYHKRLADR